MPGTVALVVQVGAEWEEIRTSFVFWRMFKGAVLSSTALVQRPVASQLLHVGAYVVGAGQRFGLRFTETAATSLAVGSISHSAARF